MRNLLPSEHIGTFIEGLKQFGTVHGPVVTEDGTVSFRPVVDPAQILFQYQRTLIPVKKYLLPPRETILSYSPAEGYRPAGCPDERIVLVAVHPCDLAAVSYLDMIFLGPCPDPFYRKRRGNLVLVGVSCVPDESCFCDDDFPMADRFDLFMDLVEDGFVLLAGSETGETILAAATPLLQESAGSAVPPRPGHPVFRALLAAASREETFADSRLWEDFSARCLSCGACSLCCPTCYCFDVREWAELDGSTAKRLREWDNCLFKSHGEIAGGTGFRKTRQERFRYRFQHKYLGFGPSRGVVSCVGCGRCREVCPVGIDLLELFPGDSHER